MQHTASAKRIEYDQDADPAVHAADGQRGADRNTIASQAQPRADSATNSVSGSTAPGQRQPGRQPSASPRQDRTASW